MFKLPDDFVYKNKFNTLQFYFDVRYGTVDIAAMQKYVDTHEPESFEVQDLKKRISIIKCKTSHFFYIKDKIFKDTGFDTKEAKKILGDIEVEQDYLNFIENKLTGSYYD